MIQENNKIFKAKFVELIDGDSVFFFVELCHETGSWWRGKCRLAHCNAPDVEPAKSTSKQALEQKILEAGDDLRIKFCGNSKYGYPKIEMYGKDGEHINEYMVDKGFAMSYEGKGKRPPNYIKKNAKN